MAVIQKYLEINVKFRVKNLISKFKNDLIDIRAKLTRRMIHLYKNRSNPEGVIKIWVEKNQSFTNLCISEIDVCALKMIYEMICFGNNILNLNEQNQYKLIIMEHTKTLRKAKMDNIECQYEKCNNTRKIRKQQGKKFVKCKICNVFKYCSRKCAKKDWKRGKHRVLCNQYI
eukprot:90800_1